MVTGSAEVMYMMKDMLESGFVRSECRMLASWELGL